MRTLVVLTLLALAEWGCTLSLSQGRDIDGRFASASPETRQWFREQRSPKTGGFCCSEADGSYVEEDIRGENYWIRSERTRGEWMLVPPDVVIKDPNRNGEPVAWYAEDEMGKLQIRCYAPGGGV